MAAGWVAWSLRAANGEAGWRPSIIPVAWLAADDDKASRGWECQSVCLSVRLPACLPADYLHVYLGSCVWPACTNNETWGNGSLGLR